jgi:hypothetical protein
VGSSTRPGERLMVMADYQYKLEECDVGEWEHERY